MRGNLEVAAYKHVALGLVFLKYVSDAFEARRQYLVAVTADPASDYFIPNPDRWVQIVESRDEYTSESVFVLANGSLSSHSPARARSARSSSRPTWSTASSPFPRKLFLNTGNGHRAREGEVLFIDACQLGRMETRTLRVFEQAQLFADAEAA